MKNILFIDSCSSIRSCFPICISFTSDVACESGLGSDSESMAELLVLLANEIPEGWQHLSESPISPETVHNCCETKLPSVGQ